MNAVNDEFVFMSIFYSREKWHLLLPQLRVLLYEEPETVRGLMQRIVYLNVKRGEGIRLALKFQPGQFENYKIVEDCITAFLGNYPSIIKETEPSVTSFFTDFPNDEIHYNLFNDLSIMPGKLFDMQVLLSKILLCFFDEHRVDDDAVFTLLVYLQERLISALSPEERLQQLLCSHILKLLKEQGDDIFSSRLQENAINDIRAGEHGYLPLSSLLSGWERECQEYLIGVNDPVRGYFTILSVIHLQVYRVQADAFYESLNHLYQRKAQVLSATLTG